MHHERVCPVWGIEFIDFISVNINLRFSGQSDIHVDKNN